MNDKMPRSSDQEIVDITLAMLMRELGADLIGLLATGSRVRGDARADSDLDLEVLIALPRIQKRTRMIRGVEVAVELGPRAAVLHRFGKDRQAGSGIAQHMWMSGLRVYDPHGVVEAVKKEASAQWRAGPRPIASGDVWQLRLGPTRMLDDVDALEHVDEAHAAHVLGCAVLRLMQAHCRLRGRWTSKAKRAFDDLSTWDPIGAQIFRRAHAGDLAARRDAAKELLDYVFKDVGGPMPRTDWETPWIELSPAVDGGRVRAVSGSSVSP